jgi:hypothetical protein
MVRPDLCYRPLVLAEYGVRHFDVQKRSLLKPSVNKGMDLRSYVDGQHEKVWQSTCFYIVCIWHFWLFLAPDAVDLLKKV